MWKDGSARRLALVVVLVAGLLGACAPDPAPSPGVADPALWAARVRGAVDDRTLDRAGVSLPDGAKVLGARIYGGGDSPAYGFFEAGEGGFAGDFFPASSIKLLAALGALDFARSLGFTGEAVVDGGYTIHDYYDAALRWSSNEDYSELVRIAGVDRLNRQFLPNHGFSSTSIQEPYGADEQVTISPEMTLTEDERQVVVAERDGEPDYGCNGSNCSTLFDLSDAVRRVMLDSELPESERFDVSASDIEGLQDALAGADGFIAPGVEDALGPDAMIFTKPGWVPELDCVETALIVVPTTGHRFLLAVAAPDDGSCEELATMAADVLRVLDRCDDGTALRADGSRVGVAEGRQSGSPAADGPVGIDCRLS